MNSLLEHLPGYIYFRFTDKYTEEDLNKCKRKSCYIDIDGEKMIINSLGWIFPWMNEIISKVHYLEIDASFKAVKPYSYCIWHGIYFNSSIPLAITIHPEEEKELFEFLFECLHKFEFDISKIENKPVLSDMGTAIKSFCDEHSMEQYFCHRHMIQDIGANCVFGFWANRLLKSKSYEEYLKNREFVLAELANYCEKMDIIPDPDAIKDENMKKRIKNLTIMLNDALEIEQEKNENNEKIKKSNYFLLRWGNWVRLEKHIARCSNHSEGAHGNINESLPKKGRRSVRSGFSTMADYILNYLNNRIDSYGLSFQKKHNVILEKIKMILSKPSKDSFLECCNLECQCNDDDYNAKIYGVKFNCIHKVLNPLKENGTLENFCMTNPNVNLKSFLIHCIDEYPKDHYENKKAKSVITIEIGKIISSYKFKECIQDINNAKQMLNNFILCLTYDLPEFIPIDTRFTFNRIKYDYEKKKYDFSKRNKINADHLIDIDNSDFEFWIKNCDLYLSRIIKEKYFETQKEINALHPDLVSKSANICFENFMDIIMKNYSNINEMNVVPYLASFKIESWMMADEIAGSNNFFG
ncbi:hypothetical protein M9Y10_004698 [Tritrichomonas musculus]|uniref:MULE transposase domain-containing protein n=1 Tax=Tritrichomonas musculus TaxID=1915356 RepID=A0ABR2JJP4_9EUKA